MSTQPTGRPSRRSRAWRVVPPLFLLAEVVLAVLLFQIVGWWTVLILLGLSAAGFLVIGTTTRRSWRDIRHMRDTGVAPDRTAGDAVFTLIAGLLLIFPGILSSLIGLVLLVPLSRTWVRRLAGVAVSRSVLRTMGVRVAPGAGGSVFGDVVPGEATSGRGSAARTYEQVPPPLLEGQVVDRPEDSGTTRN